MLSRRVRVLLWRALGMAFLTGVAWLIVSRAVRIDWSAVAQVMAGYGRAQLAGAFALSLAGYACAASYDLIGRRYVGHMLPVSRTVAINGIAYAFSLNLGALAGGWVLRLRLYTRYGLSVAQVARIIVLAVMTNWSGFVLLSGVVLMITEPRVPELGALPPNVARVLGLLLIFCAMAYPALCALARHRRWRLSARGHAMRPPSARMAMVQLALSSASWTLMALALHRLLPPGVPLVETMTALFASCVIGASTHVPGSVGVLEGSFTALTEQVMDPAVALAAVLAFRAVYFLAPFLIAAVAYATLEWRAPRRRARASSP